VLYCLAEAARKYNVLLHAVCTMSNHIHMVVTDPDDHLPEFMRWFNEIVAKAMNASLGRWENFWAPGSYSAIRLETAEDIQKWIVYTLTNPARAGIGKSAEWPMGAKRSF
jgi:putative transposase